MEKTLFIIDPQNDFIDAPEKSGSLAVPGSYEDMKRLANYISENKLDKIVVSLDTHSEMDIAHKGWWVNKEGENPSPFTMITLEDFESGLWKPVNSSEVESTHEYLKALKEGGKKTLVVWPDHCIKDTWGNDVTPILKDALNSWENKENKKVTYIRKGENPHTEHYSAVKAEVVMSNDNGYSDVNYNLMKHLSENKRLVIAGEAQSHCVADTVYDVKNYFNANNNDVKIEILSNCMSPVTGFEESAKKFIDWAENERNVEVIQVKDKKIKNKP